MKVEDLMIGDWIYNRYHCENIQITPYDFFTHGHNKSGEQFLVGNYVSGRDFEPIPLTREILEKNGWHYDELAVEFYSSDAFTVYGHKAPFGVFDGRVISYVHQLQHALRFAGLDKEIVL